MKDVPKKDMEAVLNFIHYGEVNIAQDDLNSFLQVAKDLQTKEPDPDTPFPDTEHHHSDKTLHYKPDTVATAGSVKCGPCDQTCISPPDMQPVEQDQDTNMFSGMQDTMVEQ